VEFVCTEIALIPFPFPKHSEKSQGFLMSNQHMLILLENLIVLLLLAKVLKVFLVENGYILLRIIVLPGNGK
jgi:hypothetical protein